MKGYKAFDRGLVCRGFQYEVGKTYKHDGEIGLCEAGFHFCRTPSDCAIYYDYIDCEFAEIEAIGKIIESDSKCVTDEIVIVRLISRVEFYELANNGKDNIGVGNTGDRNTGGWNAGSGNTGNGNTSYSNTGDRNSGNKNTGFRNTGDNNTGDWNAGDWNFGSYNTGDKNVGDANVGHYNTGDRNTGDRNVGDGNTGDWNCTDKSTGFFCTETQTVKIFDVDIGRTYQHMLAILPSVLWDIPYGHYWSDDGRKSYTAEDRQKFYDKLSDKDKKSIKNIPHFNAYKFEKCTGIKVED